MAIIASGNISGSSTSTGSFGKLFTRGNADVEGKLFIQPKNNTNNSTTAEELVIYGASTEAGIAIVANADANNYYTSYIKARYDGVEGFYIKGPSGDKFLSYGHSGTNTRIGVSDTTGTLHLRAKTISGSAASTGSFGSGFFDNRVGINQKAPTADLHISSPSSGAGIRVDGGYANIQLEGDNLAHISLKDEGATSGERVYQISSDGGVLSFNRTNDAISSVTATPLKLKDDKVEVLNISGSSTSTGSFGELHVDDRIGIGTKTPSQKLDVVGDIVIGGASDSRLKFFSSAVRAHIAPDQNVEIRFGFSNNQPKIFYHSTTEIARVDSSGITIASGNVSGSSTSTGSFGSLMVATGNVGINTTSPEPTAELTVVQESNNSDIIRVEKAGGGRIFSVGSDSSGHSNVSVRANNDAQTVFLSGDPSIPSRFASVSGSSTSTGSFGRVEVPAQSGGGPITLGGGAYQDVIIGDGSGTADIVLDGNAESVLRYKIGGSEKWFLMARSSNNFVFRRNSADRVTIDTNGNFAIGFNLVPTERLHVGGNIFATGNISGSATSTGSFGRFHVAEHMGIGTTTPNNAGFSTGYRVLTISGVSSDTAGVLELVNPNVASDHHLGQIRFQNLDGGSSVAASAQIHAERAGADNAAELRFSTTTGGSISENMVLDKDGNLGIGTVGPNEKLEVAGNIRLSNSTNSAIYQDSTSEFLRVSAGGSGNDTPRIEIFGKDYGGSNSGGDIIIIAGADANVQDGDIRMGHDKGAFSEALTVKYSGNVGIGNTSPNTGNGRQWLSVKSGSQHGFNYITYGNEGHLAASAVSRLRVTNNAIGYGDNAQTGIGLSPYFNKDYASMDFYWNTPTGTTGGYLAFKTTKDGGSSLNTHMTITPSGSIGIGTTTPDVLLHLKTADSPAIRLEDTTNTVKSTLYSQNSNAHVGTITNHSFIIDTNNTAAITIDTSQNLTLGGDISGSATSTGSFGHVFTRQLRGDGNDIIVQIDGYGNQLAIDGGGMKSAANADGFRLQSDAPSATNPNILPSNSDGDTGIGRAGNNALSLIAGGVEGLRVEATKISGSSTSTGSFGYLLVNGSAVGGSSPDATDGSQSLISGSTDSTGSFGRIVLDGHQNPKINFKDNDISLGEDALLGTGNSHNVAIGYRAAMGSISGYQVAIGYLALSGSGGSNNHNVAIGTETLSVNIDGNNYHNTAVGGYALQSGSYRSATAFGYAAAQKYTGTTPIVAVGASAANAVSGLNITAIGASAMNSTGSANNSVAVGSNALQKINSSLGGLTAVGYFALRNNTTGYYNTAIGTFALEDNKTGYSNVAITGYGALKENTTGNSNVAIGTNTMERNLTGVQNIAIGGNAIRYHTDSDYNIAIGVNAMQNVSVGTPTYNIAVGYWAGYNSKGDNNVMIGQAAGYSSGPTTVDFNVFIGYYAGRLFVSGSDNVAVGKNAMYQAGKLGTNANDNVAVGENALYNVGGSRNVGIGISAMSQQVVGNDNVAVGYRAGQLLASGNRTSGSNSVYIGHTTISGTNNSSNEIVIGANAIGKGTNTVVLGDDTITDIYLSEDKGAIVYGGTFSGSAFIDDGTQLNVPDYVFEPEYDLKSLEYVETHISQSKHLPGVPSRDDKEGWVSYDMGGRDMLLLEKIEELTLYIIDLEKRIKILEENK